MKNAFPASPLCSLVFPCCNEEESVRFVLENALRARELLKASSPPAGLEIIVVNDGSSDNSRKILSSFSADIVLIHFGKRKGYGAALKAGFQKAKGEYLAFCDMDSTCDPREAVSLLRAARQDPGSVIQGNRLHARSAAPRVRQIGNRLFSLAGLLLFRRYMKDPCSGFRVFKREVLYGRLFEFPEDLSFSLIMSAFCLQNKIPVKEIEISYSGRMGRSKLHPLRDGAVFLKNMLSFSHKAKRAGRLNGAAPAIQRRNVKRHVFQKSL